MISRLAPVSVGLFRVQSAAERKLLRYGLKTKSARIQETKNECQEYPLNAATCSESSTVKVRRRVLGVHGQALTCHEHWSENGNRKK